MATPSVAVEDTGDFNQNFFAGSQAIVGPSWDSYRISPYAGHDYSEPGYDMLTELREGVALAGMNQFKFKLSPSSCESYHMQCAGKDQGFTLDKLAKEPEMADTFADPRFKWYHIWMYSFNMPKHLDANVDYTDELLAAEYQETYDWAVHMLVTYEGTGKTFFVGNWEGDWELMWASGCKTSLGYNFKCVPSNENIDKYIRWSQTRKRAIDDAKAAVDATGVTIFHYIEFNLGDQNFDNHPTDASKPRPTILNSVVPYVNPDYVSYSSYQSTNRYVNHEGKWFDQEATDKIFWDVLDYAESMLSQTETDFSVMGDLTKRIFVGEFGPGIATESTLARSTAAQVFRASLQWGCPFVLQWQTYDNHSTVPLVPRGSYDLYTFTPVRKLFMDWNVAARVYVEDKNPSSDQLRLWAVDWFIDNS
jgi:hypothetical protein